VIQCGGIWSLVEVSVGSRKAIDRQSTALASVGCIKVSKIKGPYTLYCSRENILTLLCV
jgi:hypothetical protein